MVSQVLSDVTSLREKHNATIERAILANKERDFYAHYPEHPSPKIYGESAQMDGEIAYKAHLGKPYPLLQAADSWLVPNEESPYTREKLGISYPVFDNIEEYMSRAYKAWPKWKKTPVLDKAAILVEMLDRISLRFFELGFATKHTTGQGFVMAFQASGPHALDRALETIAMGVEEVTRYPEFVEWVKPMGKTEAHLSKNFRVVPKGIGLSIGCSTFPVWNTIPAVFANLITGNTSIVKAHPSAVYPMALVVEEMQKLLVEYNYDPHLVQLAVDTKEKPVARLMAEDDDSALIDFTGSTTFGEIIEKIPNKTIFTEKAGVNSVIIDSADDLQSILDNLVFSLCLYSGQMCTAPQNIFIPHSVKGKDRNYSYQEVVDLLVKTVQKFVADPQKLGVLGAIQNDCTYNRLTKVERLGTVLLKSQALSHPDYPQIRLATPTVIQIPPDRCDLYEQELFGAIAVIIPTESTRHSVSIARSLATTCGAISCLAYTTDERMIEYISDEMDYTATSVSFNFTGNFWVNQNAAFSDFHVSGGNPAGNASFTTPEFIRRRFNIVASRIYRP